MTERGRLSRERLYRYLSVSLTVATVLLLVPADWIGVVRAREEPVEPPARAIEIVRLAPETLPPPPPLPPKPEPEPEPAVEPEPEPQEVEIVELEPQLDVPDVEIPEARTERRVQRVEAQRLEPSFRAELPDAPDVTVPSAVPRRDARRVELAARTETTFVDMSAPEIDVATPRPAARQADRPSTLPVAQQLRTGAELRKSADAPDVVVPRGNTARQGHSAPIAVSGAVTGTRVVYDENPGDAREVAVATSRPAAGSGKAPQLAAAGGTSGVSYSSAPTGVAAGGGGRTTRSSGAQVDAVRARLARRYGLPLVSVDELGQRSTDAARWNVLMPQIADLLKRSAGLSAWQGGGTDPIVSVKRDKDAVVIRYRDGVVHVLVRTQEGLAALYVARGPNARDVTSKVEEAEQARKALYRFTRGAS